MSIPSELLIVVSTIGRSDCAIALIVKQAKARKAIFMEAIYQIYTIKIIPQTHDIF